MWVGNDYTCLSLVCVSDQSLDMSVPSVCGLGRLWTCLCPVCVGVQSLYVYVPSVCG